MGPVARITRVRGEAAVTIADGELEATFLPDVGFLGVSLRHRGSELLALPGGIARYRAGHVTGLPLLAPWANRLAAKRYSIAGADVDLDALPLHEDGRGLPIHGVMTAQPGWEVVSVDGGRMRAAFDFGARPELLASFPFPHQLLLDVTLAGGSLAVTTTIRPTGGRSVPVSFGWHPYFRLPGSRASTRLRLPSCGHALLDERGIPTGTIVPQPAESEPFGDRAFDDLYVLGADRRLALETRRGRSVAVDLDENFGHAQVYSPAGAPFACLEPMTAATNSLVTNQCPVVEPGDTYAARFSITPSA